MLRDTLLSRKAIKDVERMLISKAHAFRVSNIFHETAVDIFVRRDRQLSALHELFRLPYDTIWLEYADPFPMGQPKVMGKMGVLITRENLPDISHLTMKDPIFLATFVQVPSGYGYAVKGVFDATSIRIDADEQGIDRVYIDGALTVECEKFTSLDQLAHAAGSIAACIALINSPRVVTMHEENFDRLNVKREKAGKLPLLGYTVVDLNKEIKDALKGEKHTDEKRRLHFVRGHFKVRKTGVFWWNPHTAGSKELGFVEKEYVA